MLPLFFSLLSLVFGKSWRAAAANVSRAGVVAGEAIRRARTSLESSERDERIGARFPEVDDIRVPRDIADDVDLDLDAAEAHLHRLSRIPGLIIFLMILGLTLARSPSPSRCG